MTNRNGLYVAIAVLVVAVVGLAAAYKYEADKSTGISIVAGENGISIEAKE
ncbi:MAG: hypothetical protein RJB62_1847 [Pseudomonadota bacterium]|jgi:hypothetical protein